MANRLRISRTFMHFSQAAIMEPMKHGLAHVNQRQWRYGDRHNPGTSRPLNGGAFKRANSKGDQWHRLIGIQSCKERNCRRVVFVTEGAKDAMAAYELLHRCGISLDQVAVLAAQGSGYRPIHEEIAELRGCKVVVIGDRDAAGLECIRRVSAALIDCGVEHIVLFWPERAKDLFDLVELHAKEKADLAPISSDLKRFFSFPLSPSHNSTTQPLNLSTTQHLNYSTQEIAELVEPHVVTKAGTGNTWSFKLARALTERCGAALSDHIVRAALHHWFIRSRSLLPEDADFEHTLRKFYGQLSRVRFTSAGLDAARERARSSSTLPDIPGLSEPQLRVAALHRELQREAGDSSYIAPVNIVAEFIGTKDLPERARWILRQLERAGVIRCVKRGIPNSRGFKGTSSLWRYLKDL